MTFTGAIIYLARGVKLAPFLRLLTKGRSDLFTYKLPLGSFGVIIVGRYLSRFLCVATALHNVVADGPFPLAE